MPGSIINAIMKRLLLAFTALLCFTFVAAAADVTGKWTAEIPGRGGNTQTTTFTFKADGAKLEGTVANQRGENPISEGKVDGDKITFAQVMNMNGNEMKMTYTGVVKGDTIELTRDGGRGPATFTAKKAQ
jgi:opacity protein-like surface antigen